MRVALLAPEFLPITGGVGSYTVELARELANRCELHIITPVRMGSGQIKGAAFHYTGKADDDFFYNSTFQLRLAFGLNRVLKENNIDIVHNTSLVHMPDIFCKPILPHITTVHTTIESQSIKKNLLFSYIQFLQNRYIKRENNFIAVSKYIQDKILKPSKLIYNGIDIRRFCPKEEKDKTVLFCGRMLEQKGLAEIASCIKAVADSTGARFMFAGKETSFSRQLFSNIREHCIFLNYVDFEKIHKIYQNSSVIILPSHAESNPKTVIEAMACGKAVIASNVGGVPEIIDGKNGILLQGKDSLAEKIILLLNDSTLRRKMGKRARKTAEERFSSALMAKETISFYKQVLKRWQNE